MSLRPRRRSHWPLVLLAMGATALIAVPPISAASPSLVVAGVDASTAPAVTVTVASRFAPPIGEEALPASAFRLSEDGRARKVTVEALAGDDLEVVLLLDTASTDAGAFQALVGAAAEFVLGLPAGRVAVVESARQPAVIAPLSADRSGAMAALGAIEPREASALHDAVPLALRQFSSAAHGRVFVAVSAGADNASTRPLGDVAKRLRRSGAIFYGINLRTSAGNIAALDRLSAATTGQVLTADDPSLLVGLLDLVATDLANSYELSYRSNSEGRTPVTITVDHDGTLAETTLSVPMPEPATPPAAPAPTVGATSVPVTSRLPDPNIVIVAVAFLCLGLAGFVVAGRRRRRHPVRRRQVGRLRWASVRRRRMRGRQRPVKRRRVRGLRARQWSAQLWEGLATRASAVRRRVPMPPTRWGEAVRSRRSRRRERRESSSFRHLPRIWPYLRPYRPLIALAAVLTLLGVLLSLAQPWPLAFLVDSALGTRRPPAIVSRLVGSSPSHRILFAVLFGLGLTLVTNGFNIVNTYVQTRLDQRITLDVRSELFAHVQRLSLAFHDSHRKGTLMFAINNQASAVGQITVVLLPLVQAVLTLVGMVYVTYRLNPRLALLAITVVPFIYFSTKIYGARVEPRLRRVRGLEGTSLSIVHEAMSMMRVIVAFGRERHEHQRFHAQGTDAVNARIDVTVRQTAFSLGVNLITAAGTALVLGFGAQLVLRQALTVGELLVVISYIAAVYQPLEEISYTLTGLREQLISLEACVGLLDTAPEVRDPAGAMVLGRAEGRVSLDRVSFDYTGRVATLSDISFEAAAGEVVAIVGPTGAGKSTLVSLIPRFFDPKQGRVLLDGHDIRSLSLESLRSQVSLVLQEPLLFSGTIADNIRYGWLEASDEDVVEAAKAANVHDFVTRLPQQYETELGERGAQLSGGERQRISIARAFLRDAPILILDEPTSAIDSRTEAVILNALSRLVRGRTTFMIAHRLSTIRSARRILVMDHGKLVEQGSHDELMTLDGLYREMYQAQNGDRAPAGAVITLPEDAVMGS